LRPYVKIVKKLSKKRDVSLKTLLHQTIPKNEPARNINVLHGSEVTREGKRTRFCPRAYVLQDILQIKSRSSFVGTSLRLTYDMGTDLQDRITNHWLTSRVIGDWLCLSCRKVKASCLRPKGHCGQSGIYCQWRYQEIRVTSLVTGVSCGLDMLINLSETTLRLVEIKTMVKEQFKALKTPVDEHALRTNLYLRVIAESDHPIRRKINTESAVILYVSKSYGVKDKHIVQKKGVTDIKFSPFKEFAIIRDDKKTDAVCHQAQLVFNYRQGKKLIPKGICGTSYCGRAMNCPVVKACFSGKFPGFIE